MLPLIGAMLGPVVSAIGKIAGSWLETRKAKAEGKIAITHAKIAARVKMETAKYDMDLASLSDMRFSWKDEYLVILLSIPFIMAFIPYLAPYALAGFAVVDTMPGWYQWAFTGIIAATFGIRTWKFFKK